MEQLAAIASAAPRGSCEPIVGPAAIQDARPNQVALLGSAKLLREARDGTAGCLLTSPQLADELQLGDRAGLCMLITAQPELAWCSVLRAFMPPVEPIPVGVAPSARVHPHAQVDPSARVGEGVVVGRAAIGAEVTIHPGVVIADDVTIGAGTAIGPNVVIRERVKVGQRCVLQAGAVIGAEGFGYTFAHGKHHAIPHLGGVELGDDVEIGANSAVDRGKLGDTRVGDGTKIDNLCQIGHNCQIGKHVVIVGQCGLSGSVTVGDYAVLAGKAGVADHVEIGPRAKVGAYAGVMADVEAGQAVLGVPAHDARQFFREVSSLRRLPELLRSLKALEQRVEELERGRTTNHD